MQKVSCVLLVDDDSTTNYLNQLLLRRLGVGNQTLVALNGKEALSQLQTHCQDADEEAPILIFLDVKMPVMDGFEFLDAFEKLPLARRKSIVIVVLTTSLHPQDLRKMQQYTISAYLNKPLTQEKVERLLKEHFVS